MIIDDVLYFVVDDTTRPKYEEKGMHPFSYQKKTGVVNVRKYYAAPEELFEDEEQMTEWAREALETAVKERAWKNFDNYNEGFLFSVKRSQEEYSCIYTTNENASLEAKRHVKVLKLFHACS